MTVDRRENTHRRAPCDFKRLFDLSRDLLAIASARDGHWQRVNPAFTEVLGWSEEELLAMPYLDIVHPDDLGRSREAASRLAQGEPLTEFEHRVRTKDGCYRRISWETWCDAAEGLFYCAGRDVTVQRQTEREVAEKYRRHRTLFDSMSEGLMVGEMVRDVHGRPVDFRILETNPAFGALTGFSPREAVGKTARELVSTIEQHWIERFSRVCESAESLNFENYSTALGRWFQVHAFPLDGGRFGCLFVDITERQHTERALEHQKELLEAIVQNIPVMLVMWDPRLESFQLNPESERVFGWTTEEAQSIDLLSAVYPDPEYRKEVIGYMRSLQPGWRDLTLVAKDGRRTETSWANVKLSDDRMIGIGVDISERKRTERCLRAAQKELEEKVRQRTAELQMRADQLSRLASELTVAEQRERHRLAQVLHDHLQQLLVAAQMRLRQLSAKAAMDHKAVLNQLEELISDAIRESRSLTVELAPPILREGFASGLHWLADWMRWHYDLEVELRLDRRVTIPREDVRILLFQSTRELLFNVAKHAGSKTALVATGIHEEGTLFVSVSDRGVGFDPAAIFDRKAGTGFGLLSIRERLSVLGGRLTIDSAPGRETKVTITAPHAEIA